MLQRQNRYRLNRDLTRRAFWLAVLVLCALKAVLASFQMIYIWAGGAPLDDELLFGLAQSIRAGEWLGVYNCLTLAKNSFFALWLAALNLLHIPYLVGGQLLWCGASLAGALAFAPVLPRRRTRLALFAVLAFAPSAMASYTLRVYRDNIFPALCLFFFAGLSGYALRCAAPKGRAGVGWLVLAGLGLGSAWLCREDGAWLLPFAVVGGACCAAAILTAGRGRPAGDRPRGQKAVRCLALLLPFALLAGCIGAWSAANVAHYGLFAVSDFSSGPFASAIGAMNRVQEDEFIPRVSIPADVRARLYDTVPQLAPLKPWLEEDEQFRNSFCNPVLNDYQSGSFYWAVRLAAQRTGAYETAQSAAAYWQSVADAINAACDSGALPASGGARSSTTPPIELPYVLPTLAEGLKGFGWAAVFADCAPYYSEQRSIGTPEDVAEYERFLSGRVNVAAQAGTDLPYYSPLQRLVYALLNALRLVYAVCLPLALLAALWRQGKRGIALLRGKPEGSLLLWGLLLGLLLMALLRCFMIGFVETASFGIGTSTMYLATVHPLLLLFAAVGLWEESECPNC